MSIPLPGNVFSIPSTRLGSADRSRFGTGSDFVTNGAVGSARPDVQVSRVVAERLGAQQFQSTELIRDLNGGIAVAQAADDGLARIEEELGRLDRLSAAARESARDNATNEEGTNGVLTDAQRSQYQRKFDEIIDRIRDIADESEFRGIALLRAADDDAEGYAFSGRDGESFEVPIEDFSLRSLGLVDFDVAGEGTKKALEGARERVQGARSSIADLSRNVAISIDRELRRTPAARRIQSPTEAETVAADTRSSLVLDSSFGTQVHLPRFDSAASVLA